MQAFRRCPVGGHLAVAKCLNLGLAGSPVILSSVWWGIHQTWCEVATTSISRNSHLFGNIFNTFIALKLTSRVSLWRYAWGNRHAYVSHMFCECISNWYEVYWISKWTKAQEQQNSHKQNSVAYPADCLPNCSPVYLSISWYILPSTRKYDHIPA